MTNEEIAVELTRQGQDLKSHARRIGELEEQHNEDFISITTAACRFIQKTAAHKR